MINKKVEQKINEQINAELYSAYLYLSMAAYCESSNLPGIATWLYVQFQEETAHAMKFYRYLNERGWRVVLTAIDKPQSEWKDLIDVFKNVYEHEQKVTGLINDLVDVAAAEKDHATVNMLQWYVAEQVEEEANASGLLAQVEMIGGKGSALLMLDRELKQRVFIDETLTSE
jgi:ferritin